MAKAADRIVDWDQLYPGRFFKGGDIPEGDKVMFTIEDVDTDELEGDKGKKEKGILILAGQKKQLPLNKTNGICLREMFGRKPRLWPGKRFAVYQDVWDHQPCIRIWGSPDIEHDITVTIELPRRKAFKMTMHAMKDGRQQKPRAVASVAKAEPLGDRAQEVLKLMLSATDLDTLQDIEANIADETFNGRETRALQGGFAKRREQIAAEAAKKADDDDLPF